MCVNSSTSSSPIYLEDYNGFRISDWLLLLSHSHIHFVCSANVDLVFFPNPMISWTYTEGDSWFLFSTQSRRIWTQWTLMLDVKHLCNVPCIRIAKLIGMSICCCWANGSRQLQYYNETDFSSFQNCLFGAINDTIKGQSVLIQYLNRFSAFKYHHPWRSSFTRVFETTNLPTVYCHHYMYDNDDETSKIKHNKNLMEIVSIAKRQQKHQGVSQSHG